MISTEVAEKIFLQNVLFYGDLNKATRILKLCPGHVDVIHEDKKHDSDKRGAL
jgi:hypothetical protein